MLVGCFLLHASNNVSQGPLLSLIPDLVPTRERPRAASYKAAFELLPLLASIPMAILLGQGGVELTLFIIAAVNLSSLLLTVLFMKKDPLNEKPADPIGGTLVDFLNCIQPGLGYIAILTVYAARFLLSSVAVVTRVKLGAGGTSQETA